MKKYIIVISVIFASAIGSLKADGTLFSWGGKDLEGMTSEKFDASKKWTTDDILNKIRTANEWPSVYLLIVASKQYKEDKVFIDSLINLVSNTTETKLHLTSRLIIWERITSGDILFEGKGVQIGDDLFKVAGRANWILRFLTGKNFGFVKLNHNTDSLKILKNKWTSWSEGKTVDEYKDPYETTSKGIDEIKSYEALEAIINSLKKSREKEELTKNCLSKIYKLTELPKDPSSPATMCSPDTYAYMYLTMLTDIENREPYEWWAKWWSLNKDKLIWDKEKGKFHISK